MPRPVNPLSAAFDEIESMAQEYGRPLAPGEGPPNNVGREELRVISGLRPVSADLARAEDLQDVGRQTSNGPDATEQLGPNQGSQVLLTDESAIQQANATLALFQVSNAEPKVLTVTLGTPVLVHGAGGFTKVTAVIQLGNGGFQETAEVDFVAGSSFQVHASFLRVSARIDRLNGGTTGPSGDKWQVGAFVTQGPTPRASKLVKSLRAGPIAAAGNFQINIPPMATEFRFLWAPIGGANPVAAVSAQVEDKDGNVLYEVNIGADPDAAFPLASQANHIIFHNNEVANAMTDSYAIFTVEL